MVYYISLYNFIQQADILCVATGVKHLVKGDWIKQDAVVIDIGISAENKNGKRKLYGDVEYAKVLNINFLLIKQAKDKCKLITPVPGGIGPLTIMMLIKNTIKAWKSNFLYENIV